MAESEASMDRQIAHELAQQMGALTREVAGLRASFDIYGPMLEQQVNGLADVTNRQTKLAGDLSERQTASDGRITALSKDFEAHCRDQKEAEKEERESRRWAYAQLLVAVGAITAIVQVLISMIGHK